MRKRMTDAERRQRKLEGQRARRAADPEKARAESSKWRLANPEKSREKSRRWRAANLEYARERERASNAKNKDRRVASARAWRAANLERSRENSKKWALANPDKVRENNRKWTSANPDKVVAQRLAARLKLYGVTHEEWFSMLARQNGACPVCLRAFGSVGCRPNIDHCHSTGSARGILCGTCNTGLGHFKDDPDRLARAAAYLRSP